jgi:hypothetical protein
MERRWDTTGGQVASFFLFLSFRCLSLTRGICYSRCRFHLVDEPFDASFVFSSVGLFVARTHKDDRAALLVWCIKDEELASGSFCFHGSPVQLLRAELGTPVGG